jgi:hypothetical protein
MRDLLLPFHRQIFCTIDEWFPQSLEEIREYEKSIQEKLNLVKYKTDPKLVVGERVEQIREEDQCRSPMPEKKKAEEGE